MEEALIPNAAHAFNPTEEEKKHANDIMMDDSFLGTKTKGEMKL
mgnify:CR=1 FL=1